MDEQLGIMRVLRTFVCSDFRSYKLFYLPSVYGGLDGTGQRTRVSMNEVGDGWHMSW